MKTSRDIKGNVWRLFVALGVVCAGAQGSIKIKDCSASAMEDINWAVRYVDNNLNGILGRATYLPSKYTDRIKDDWDKTSIKCSSGGPCLKSNSVGGFHSTGHEIKLCWDNARQPDFAMTRCDLVGTILHEKGHAAGIPIEKKHNDWLSGYFYVPRIDLVYRFGNDALAYCQETVDNGTPSVDWTAGSNTLESSNTGKLVIGEFCSRDSQCTTNKCEKGVCGCRDDQDCSGDLRCVNRIGKNFCVPPADNLGAYCKANSDCNKGTCEQNACSCKTDSDCHGVGGPVSRCAKPVLGKNYCQSTNAFLGLACGKDSDCQSGKCKGDICVPK